jgi:hypothetical protein
MIVAQLDDSVIDATTMGDNPGAAALRLHGSFTQNGSPASHMDIAVRSGTLKIRSFRKNSRAAALS